MDVVFAEDKLMTKKENTTAVSVHITISGAEINKFQTKNKIAPLENFADNFDELIKWCKEIKVIQENHASLWLLSQMDEK
jgi:hypothetical protein